MLIIYFLCKCNLFFLRESSILNCNSETRVVVVVLANESVKPVYIPRYTYTRARARTRVIITGRLNVVCY